MLLNSLNHLSRTNLQSNITIYMSLKNSRQNHQGIEHIPQNTSSGKNHGKQPSNIISDCTPPHILTKSQNTSRSECIQNNSESSTSRAKKIKKTKKKKGKSAYFSNHNFQKHTVVTVKKLGEEITKNIGVGQAEELAKRIWRIFLSSDINSKKILLILFGRANFKKECCRELFRRCYLGEVCICDEKVVQEAQSVLRKSFLSMVDDDIIRVHTRKARNIYQKQEFIAYFLQFVEQLKRGPFVKSRIDNSTKKKIEKRIRAEKRMSKVQLKRNKVLDYQQLQ